MQFIYRLLVRVESGSMVSYNCTFMITLYNVMLYHVRSPRALRYDNRASLGVVMACFDTMSTYNQLSAVLKRVDDDTNCPCAVRPMQVLCTGECFAVSVPAGEVSGFTVVSGGR